MTCPDCGERVVEAVGALSKKPLLYTPTPTGNLVARDGVMVSREKHLNAGASGHRVDRVIVTPGPRFVLHSTVCLGDEALSNWHELDQDPSEVLA